MKLRSIVVLVAAGGLALTGCSSSDDSADGGDATGDLKVWLMPELPDEILEQVNTKFAETYPDVTVTVERQEWGSVNDRLTTALGTDATPDVAEIGNSLTAKFSSAGLFTDLTDKEGDLNADGWTAGLKESTALDGKTWAAPMYGAGRALVYNKTMWDKAGLSDPPKTLEEFEANLGELKKANSDASAFWFPGKYWYGALPWIWGYGGELATDDGGTWTGAVDSDESKAGLTDLQSIVDEYSKAPKDATEATAGGGQSQVFSDGKAATALMLPWEIDAIKGQEVGMFALPGVTEGSAPQFLGGSNLAISKMSPQQDAALGWIQAYLDEDIQKAYAEATNNIPAIEAASSALTGDLGKVQQELAKTGKFTPNDATWANVESQEVLPNMLVKMFTGGDEAAVNDSTSEASQQITSIMGG